MEENMILNDNLLDKPIFNFIKDKVTNDIQWNFIENTGSHQVKDSPSLYSIISDETGPRSSLYDILCIPLLVSCYKNNINISKILRIRAGLILSNTNQITHTPHVDYTYPHKTMLFYLTNSDGPTVLFKQKHAGDNKHAGNLNEKFLQVQQHITPVENKSVIFDGLQFHSSTTPKDDKFRIVINYNFID
jgi:hypothetical protein